MNADLTLELYFLQFRIREIDDCSALCTSPTALVSCNCDVIPHRAEAFFQAGISPLGVEWS